MRQGPENGDQEPYQGAQVEAEIAKPNFTDKLRRDVDLFNRYRSGNLRREELETLADSLWTVDTTDRRFMRGALSEPPDASTLIAPKDTMAILIALRQQLLDRGPLTPAERERADIFGDRIAVCLCLDGAVPRRKRWRRAYQMLSGLSYASPIEMLQPRVMWFSEVIYRLVVEFGFDDAGIDITAVKMARTATVVMAQFPQSSSRLHDMLQQYCEFTLLLAVPGKETPERAAWAAEQMATMKLFGQVSIQPGDSAVSKKAPTGGFPPNSSAQRDAALACRLVGAALVQDDRQLVNVAAPFLAPVTVLNPLLADHDDLQVLILTLVAIGRAHAAQGRGLDAGLSAVLGALRRKDLQELSNCAFGLKIDTEAHVQAIKEITALLGSSDRSPEHQARRDAAYAKLDAYHPPLLTIDPRLMQQGVDEMLSPKGTGRRGLALSGGGFRAACFHVGVMACLADYDQLRKVNMLSCVSGGSIAGAAYAVRLKALLAGKHDLEITQDDYRELVANLVGVFTAVAGMNLRAVAFGNPLAMLRMWLQHDYTFTERIADLLDRHLFAPLINSHPDYVDLDPKALDALAASGKGQTRPSDAAFERIEKDRPIGWPLAMWDLRRPPHCEPTDFEIGSRRNDLRRAKCPELFINTTLLNTGGPFLFSTSANGEPIRSLRQEISKMPSLKWLSYGDINAGGDLDPKTYRLSRAVAASAAVPGLLPPMLFRRTKQKALLALADGGVCDNQGFNALFDQGCDWILASDAAAQLSFKSFPEVANFSVIASSTDFLMERVREMSYEAAYGLAQRNPNVRFMALHLTRGLSDPLPVAMFDLDQSLANQRHEARTARASTDFGVSASCQMLLANVRTDLDSFSEIEVMSLMADGYMQAEEQMRRDGSVGSEPMRAWAFKAVEPALSNFDPKGRVARVLSAARLRFLRLPLLASRGLAESIPGRAVLVIMACVLPAAFGAALWQVWSWLEGGQSLQRILQGVFAYALALVSVHFLPPMGAKRWLWKFLSLPYLLVAMVHAWTVIGVSDPIYRRLGKLRS